MSGFWELLVLDPGPRGPGASWEDTISNMAANTELPLTLKYSTTDCNVNTACGQPVAFLNPNCNLSVTKCSSHLFKRIL